MQLRTHQASTTSEPLIESDSALADGDQRTPSEAELEELIKEITIDGMCGVY